nr:cisplatin damage response ATP-dependent DNA ligase [Sphingomonas sp.]
MRAFSQLLDDLVYTRSRNTKLRLIGDYLKETPDPDRGYGLAALTGSLDIPHVKPAAIRGLVEERIDPVLFYMSRDYVGDTAETIALLWPNFEGEPSEVDDATISISEAIERLRSASKMDAPHVLGGMLDHLDASGRFALLKLALGALRVGINARLARQALADAFGVKVEAVEEVWHLKPPFTELFEGVEGRAEQPTAREMPVFRPFMLAHPLEETRVSLNDYAAEWKWDGIRVQLVHAGGETRLYSRTGDDISASFPDIAEAFRTPGVLDGELLVRGSDQGVADVHGGAAASFNALQQRLGRKNVSQKMLGAYPAFVRLYDVLFEGDEDLRELAWEQRRPRLESFASRLDPERFDVSQLIEAGSFEDLENLRLNARDVSIEGIMLKRRDSPYVAGRRTGQWYKRKRCWTDEGELLPVGKAYFGFTDEELKWLDRWIRGHTIQRFGPVREVEKSLVLEVAFDSIHKSTRHKSGLAMRFPRISRIRIDKPAAEADRVATLLSMVT